MNKNERDVLLALADNHKKTQRDIANATNLSLGETNKTLKSLINKNLITEKYHCNNNVFELIDLYKPRRAVILADGFGVSMVPINTVCPKGLLEIKGDVLIERIIKQLNAVDVREIFVVVGYMKEKYEYLIDKYGVKLIYNADYQEGNSVHSLFLSIDYINNAYIVPCNFYADRNLFNRHELYSWYGFSSALEKDSCLRATKTGKVKKISKTEDGNHLSGIAYVSFEESEILRRTLIDDSKNHSCFGWEDLLFCDRKPYVYSKIFKTNGFHEVDTYEQLRAIDPDSGSLKNDALDEICAVFNCTYERIHNISLLKKGMTNRSFIFEIEDTRYIMRIPGEGTDLLLNRYNESCVYELIKNREISDDVIYINPNKGYKISRYIEDCRVCDPHSISDLSSSMKLLKKFHNMRLKVDFEFDLFEKIEFYQSLWCGRESLYKDYDDTKKKVFSLRSFLSTCDVEKTLTHIDSIPDNFLFDTEGNVRLIDWEYSAMQDPHVDIAMFCIYSLYEKSEVDELIDLYFEGNCSLKNRIKIYSYIAICGLLWSNWCEYKYHLGIVFGEYSIRQYRYAKEFYSIVQEYFYNE